jgi:hypothetical protein
MGREYSSSFITQYDESHTVGDEFWQYIVQIAYTSKAKRVATPCGRQGYSSYSVLISALDGVTGQGHAPGLTLPPGKGPPVSIG